MKRDGLHTACWEILRICWHARILRPFRSILDECTFIPIWKRNCRPECIAREGNAHTQLSLSHPRSGTVNKGNWRRHNGVKTVSFFSCYWFSVSLLIITLSVNIKGQTKNRFLSENKKNRRNSTVRAITWLFTPIKLRLRISSSSLLRT